MLERGYVTNMIFFGPPGTGKTTAASIIAKQAGMHIRHLNATTASLSDIREVIAETDSLIGRDGVLLYLDEIQYFNKKQQQSLLEFLEDGRITLIASTTENPYIYVYNAIISRSAVMEFKSLSADDIKPLVLKALSILNNENGTSKTIGKEALEYVAACGAGDARRALNLTENVFHVAGDEITVEDASSLMPGCRQL
jgi:putative ATPase